jgi:hypothetical protein
MTMRGVFEGYVPWTAGGIVALFVFVILYFPLFRPIADMISDRLSTAVQRGRHIRSGSGLEDLPERPSAVRCTICGDPFGPICPKCQAEINRGTRF